MSSAGWRADLTRPGVPPDAVVLDGGGPDGADGAEGPAVLGGAWPDPESSRWIERLAPTGPHHREAVADLRDLLLRAAFAELRRRRGRHPLAGPELDDLAHQAADDATLSVIGKLADFRGESRFTTWAYRFVILEVSTKLGRHFWRHPIGPLDGPAWDELPDRFGVRPEDHVGRAEMVSAVRRAVTDELTKHQRRVFVALVVDCVPLDALAEQLGSNRNAIYKTMFDARQRLRASLVRSGHLDAGSTALGSAAGTRREGS